MHMVTANTAKNHVARSVFLSHSSADAALASQLCDRLEAQGVSCWLAPRDVVPSRPYAEECVRGIEQSNAFILLASANAISSVQVLSEVEQAHKRNKPLYTIMIGKPRVTRELDYYISRLHWIEYGGDSVDHLADRLAKVISGRQDWSQVASPPSFRRTVIYHGSVFVGSALATAIVLMLAAVALYYWANHQLELDYRRLGFVNVAAAPEVENSTITIKTRVWLLAEGVAFRQVSFVTAAENSTGAIDRQDHSKLFDPDQVGSHELIQFPIPADTRQLTTCLTVPSPGLHARCRVTQRFSLRGGNTLSPAADPIAEKDNGAPCGSVP